MKIQLWDTTVATMEEFFVWTFTPQPKIDESLPFSEVALLGIFAWKYQISALSNQVTDMIRSNLASNEWKLQAAMVDNIYQAAPADSPLREVIKAALGQMPRSIVNGEDWEATFKKHADLGWDFFKAGDKEWTSQEYLSGVCRFHNHQGINRHEGLCDGCPYAQNDCYPRWEDDTKQHQASPEEDKEETKVDDAPREEVAPTEEQDEKTAGEEEVIDKVEIDEPDRPVSPEVAAEKEAEKVNGVEAPVPLETDGVADTNGHAEVPEVPVAAVEDANGVETPREWVTGTNDKIGDEHEEAIEDMNEKAPSESVAESAAGDREETPALDANDVKAEEKAGETVPVRETIEVESPKPSKNKKKKNKRLSMSQHR